MNKFQGEGGRERLIEAIRSQRFVECNCELATQLADCVEILNLRAGDILIKQGNEDDDLFMILSGSFEVRINNKIIIERFSGEAVGEMAAVQPLQRRSADVVSKADSVVAKLTQTKLTEIGDRHPSIWRFFAKDLARKLLERNRHLAAPREKIRIFVISSAEALEIAREIQGGFEYDDFYLTLWTDGVFSAGSYPIESLEKALDDSDFAIAIAQPDDLTETRGKERSTPRDNVIFELGFFMGRLGRHRTILVEPRNDKIDLPSDLTGIEKVSYRYREEQNLEGMIAPVCNRIRKYVKELGPIR